MRSVFTQFLACGCVSWSPTDICEFCFPQCRVLGRLAVCAVVVLDNFEFIGRAASSQRYEHLGIKTNGHLCERVGMFLQSQRRSASSVRLFGQCLRGCGRVKGSVRGLGWTNECGSRSWTR